MTEPRDPHSRTAAPTFLPVGRLWGVRVADEQAKSPGGARRVDPPERIQELIEHFNLGKMHSSIRMTPAMKAGITNRVWSVGELLAA